MCAYEKRLMFDKALQVYQEVEVLSRQYFAVEETEQKLALEKTLILLNKKANETSK